MRSAGACAPPIVSRRSCESKHHGDDEGDHRRPRREDVELELLPVAQARERCAALDVAGTEDRRAAKGAAGDVGEVQSSNRTNLTRRGVRS